MGRVLWNRCGDGDAGAVRGLKWLLLWGAGVDAGVEGVGDQWPIAYLLMNNNTKWRKSDSQLTLLVCVCLLG